MRILIAEDEVGIAKALKLVLEKNRFAVDMVHNGLDALDYMLSVSYDAVVLDIMMPGLDGLEVLRRAREKGIGTPVLFLTAKAEVEDRIAGLDAGADDYLPKPFAMGEFISRVRALTRRSGNYAPDVIRVGGTSLDLSSYTLSAKGQSVRLNNKEFQLMELFMRNRGRVFSTDALMQKVWDLDTESETDVVWTYIGFLRKKLRGLDADVEIKTIRGAGYALEEKIMLVKMRRRFIASAMAAMGAVTLVLLVAVNLWNYTITTNRLDDTIDALLGHGSYTGSSSFTLPDIFSGDSPEAKYMTRYFAVVYDSDGDALRVYSDYIASVSAQEALYYASDALSGGHEQGYYGDYRYCVKSASSGSAIVFLNASPEQQSMKTLLTVSLFVAALSLLLGFVLVTAFSKKAIAPYIRNIELQKQFITDAGHELKTPLTSISTSADVLRMENGENEWVDNIQKQTVRMSRLVKNLVTLSRLDEGMPLPDKSEFSLSDAAWEAAEPFEMRARAQGKSYSQSISPDLTMTGDMAAVQQLISILLDNAFKYSDDGGEIRLSVFARHKSRIIEVYNTCPPDSLGDIDRFFDRFYRADKSRRYDGGTGIGLAIAKATAQALGGSISAETPDGKSIIFRVTL